MANEMTRRETLKRGLTAMGVLALVPEWALPRLLDGYFAQQSTDDLDRRAGQVQVFLAGRLVDYQLPQGQAPRPILQPTDPLTVAPGVYEALGNASDFGTSSPRTSAGRWPSSSSPCRC